MSRSAARLMELALISASDKVRYVATRRRTTPSKNTLLRLEDRVRRQVGKRVLRLGAVLGPTGGQGDDDLGDPVRLGGAAGQH
jgi:hypothetical protein